MILNQYFIYDDGHILIQRIPAILMDPLRIVCEHVFYHETTRVVKEFLGKYSMIAGRNLTIV